MVIYIRGERSDKRNAKGAGIAKSEAEDATEDAENEAFKEELEEDIEIGSANGFSDADFVSAFGDGDEHDIHNANTANEEGNASNEGKHARDDV